MPGIDVAIVLLLILCNGLLAMSELAVVSSRRARLATLRDAGRRGAETVLRLLDDPTAFLSTVQVGITLIGVLAGAFSGATLAEPVGFWLDGFAWIEPHGRAAAMVLVVLGVTYLSLVLGELVPKRVALRDPEGIAVRVAPTLQALSRFAAPVVWLLRGATDGVLGLLGMKDARASSVTEDEVRLLLAEGTRAGVFVPKEREMIEAVLRLADRTARGIMTPRNDVAWLDENASPTGIAALLAASRRSRFPVCRETLDHPVGIVQAKDLAQAALAGGDVTLTALMTTPLVVLDGTPVLRLLDSFRRERMHMAIVVDEYGATLGVVTLGDILEAVAGDLPEAGETREQSVVQTADGDWLVDGGTAIDEFEDRVGVSGLRGSRSYDTVAGFALYRLGHLPDVGERFEDRCGRFEIVDMDGRRIDKILFRPAVEEEG